MVAIAGNESFSCLVCTEMLPESDMYPLPCTCSITVCKGCIIKDKCSTATSGSRCPQCRQPTGETDAADYSSDDEYYSEDEEFVDDAYILEYCYYFTVIIYDDHKELYKRRVRFDTRKRAGSDDIRTTCWGMVNN